MAFIDREQRLKFLGLESRDKQALQALRPLFQKYARAIEDAFYDHLLSVPETAQLLRDRTTVERLKQLQYEYLMRLVQGDFDEAYFADRIRIGQAHERVGLSPAWYLGAYSQYFKLFAPLIQDHYRQDPQRATESLVALEKAFMLDASLAMEAYIASDRFRHLQQLNSIVSDSADVIFSLDEDSRFRTWNRAAEQIFGWRAEEIIGQHFSVIVPPELVKDGELVRIEEHIRRDGHYYLETVRMAKDGRRVNVEVTVSVMKGLQGNVIGRSAIVRDITERKRLEETKLQSERLAVIGAMSAKLAHEIRNPLSSITLNFDLASDEIESLARGRGGTADEARALLKSIASEVRRIQRVTEDYLQFARMPKPHRAPIAVSEVLGNGLAFMQSLFAATGVVVETEFAPSLPLVNADDEQLWQAILNLIRNAIEAMPNGGTLRVSTNREGDHVVIQIADTGGGMNQAEHEQIFKPFFSTKTGGTGLGLPLTQQIIVEHEGTIECQSTVGQGTTFVIRLPQTGER